MKVRDFTLLLCLSLDEGEIFYIVVSHYIKVDRKHARFDCTRCN